MPTGCGDWNNGTYDFCANVTIPDCTGSPWTVPWYIIGDTWGAAPHSVSGTADLVCSLPGVYLIPGMAEGSGCNGTPQTYTFSLYNNTGAADLFLMEYTVVDDGVLTGPATIDADDDETVTFDVTLTPDLCTIAGQLIEATIFADGTAYDATAVITHTITTVGGWEAVPASAPSWSGAGYPRDGCTAHNADGDLVTYIFGDTSGIVGFWGYNHTDNLWYQPAPAGVPADRWAPDWAYDEVNNLCYVTGGATTPGGGNLSEAYLFDPVANAFTTLGSFTSVRDFHTSWLGTLDGTDYLCIGGGVNASSAMVTSTQCYDLSQAAPGAWDAENAQMDALPLDPFGAADGVLHALTGDQFWFVGGAIEGGATLSDQAWYWDDADDAWHPAGNTGVPRYRVEGDFLDGEFYQVGGSSGGFTPTTDVVKGTYDGMNWVWSAVPSLTNQRMDNVANAAEGTMWSIDGYGATAVDYVEYLAFCPLCLGPVIEVDPLVISTTLDAGDVGMADLIIGNIGSGDLVVTSITVPVTDTWLTVPATLPISITAGTTVTFTVNIDTALLDPGTYTSTITIASNDTMNPEVTVDVTLIVNELELYYLYLPLVMNESP
jgi:hypothetical protein